MLNEFNNLKELNLYSISNKNIKSKVGTINFNISPIQNKKVSIDEKRINRIPLMIMSKTDVLISMFDTRKNLEISNKDIILFIKELFHSN